VIVVDTSVAVPAALPEHEAHSAVLSALPREKTRALAQVVLETYSVLTRLPRSQRVPADMARRYLTETFDFPPLVLAPKGYAQVLDLAAAEGITGGAVCDAIVAATAVEAGATLLTRDRRAVTTYQQLGAAYRLIG
jgi:predicted nucleic acid-binding protein